MSHNLWYSTGVGEQWVDKQVACTMVAILLPGSVQ